MIDPQEFWLLLPEMFLAAVAMLLLVGGSFGRGIRNRPATGVALVALATTALLVFWADGQAGGAKVFLAGMFILDKYALFLKLVLLMATALTIAISGRYLEEGGYRPGEYYSLVLFAVTGMLFMVSGYSLLSIWISLELMALSSYVLAGYFKRERKSNEAALKYFILGALSSGILLYGVSLLYGATGTVQISELAEGIAAATAAGESQILISLGWLLMAIGLFFKVAAAPFHVWTPDVYVGAPTPVTAFLASASKTASFAILIRILYEALPALVSDWQLVTAVVACLSMIWGNLAALTQTNVKRMLAYSSIGHAGYVLIGVLCASEEGLWAALFYLLAYTFITLGAFAMVIVLEQREYAGETYADYAGLARRSPFLAAAMLVFMVALTGIPPTGGFFGKIYLFAAAIESGWIWVAVVGVLTSAVSLFFYFGIVVQMYLKPSDDTTPKPMPATGLTGAIAICAAVTLLLGLFPGPVVEFAKASLLALP